ncbi:MAG: Asp-tRNA(Asn)/Glu-tRNA(Gln) amidotransferase subunit GatA, partial [Gammaproteobacteria bacterium]|nr:Asp-tRNA(Asn)/Glu-tRNA(Gln) amidotransferase subunit GatA [Gammaproteobacteria bacterium]
MHKLSVSQLVDGLSNGDFSSVELTQCFVNRMQKFNDLNAFITELGERAILQATNADKLIKEKKHGPLTGIPIAHKDIFCMYGVKTSCGSKMLDNFYAPYDATVVEKLDQAGCVTIGRTNMDEFAMGSSNESSYYGPVKNPWNTDCVPGGSSGGSAAAVAARIAPLATGTDTGGSIRQPAALCGVTGLKPTYGRVSRYGLIAYASSLDQGGPFGKSAEDCAYMLQAMAGFDEKDSTSLDKAVPDYTQLLNSSLEGKVIGVPEEYFSEGLSAEVKSVIEGAIKWYEQQGCEIKNISLPNTNLAIPAYYVIAPAECSSNLSRLDGVRYGYRCEDPKDLRDLYDRSRSEAFGDEVKRRIMIGTYALSAGYYDAYYLKAQQIRRLISEDFKKAFEHVDVILGPTTPEPAFKIGEKTADPVTMYLSDIYTISINLAGLPAMSVPCGFSDSLPVGM